MKNKFKIFCDFDGTITVKDTLFSLLKEMAHPDWLVFEQLWIEKKITTIECLWEQAKLLPNTKHDIINFISGIEIDETFHDFYDSLKAMNIPFDILSDGIKGFISRILTKYSINDIDIYSNEINFEKYPFEMHFPYANPEHKHCAVCKGKIVQEAKNKYKKTVFIGDGYSELH